MQVDACAASDLRLTFCAVVPDWLRVSVGPLHQSAVLAIVGPPLLVGIPHVVHILSGLLLEDGIGFEANPSPVLLLHLQQTLTARGPHGHIQRLSCPCLRRWLL